MQREFQRINLHTNGVGALEGCEVADADGKLLVLPGHAGITLPPREIEQVVEVFQQEGWHWSYNKAMDRKLPRLLYHLQDALEGGGSGTPGKALVFVSTRTGADQLGMIIRDHFGLDRCGVMHGQKKQEDRERILRSFRMGALRAVVATDVVGRGVDIENVTHVVIFDMPNDIETYVHRVGRTGRNGRTGKSVAFFEPGPWYPDLGRELAEVLQACQQKIPDGLDGARVPWGNLPGSGGQEQVQGEHDGGDPASHESWPPLVEADAVPLASHEELGAWHADGARVWAYSANGGETVQGKMELRARGRLRTTWGWGTWALQQPVPGATCTPAMDPKGIPHCPPPSRLPPPPTRPPPPATWNTAASAPAQPQQQCDDAMMQIQAEGSVAPAVAAQTGLENVPPRPSVEDPAPQASADASALCKSEVLPRVLTNTAARHMALTWNGVTDVVALDESGGGFQLVTRNGRPAHTYRKKTIGWVLSGVVIAD